MVVVSVLTRICCFPQDWKSTTEWGGLEKTTWGGIKRGKTITLTITLRCFTVKRKYYTAISLTLTAPESHWGAQTRSGRIQGSSSSQRQGAGSYKGNHGKVEHEHSGIFNRHRQQKM